MQEAAAMNDRKAPAPDVPFETCQNPKLLFVFPRSKDSDSDSDSKVYAKLTPREKMHEVLLAEITR